MKLSQTKVCINCDEVFEEGFSCPKCSSAVFMPLSRWLTPLEPQPFVEDRQKVIDDVYWRQFLTTGAS